MSRSSGKTRREREPLYVASSGERAEREAEVAEGHGWAPGAALARPGRAGATALPASTAALVDDAARGGRGLDAPTRVRSERRLGQDLARVRVHDDSAAHRAADALDAQAFTYGDHVVLGRDAAAGSPAQRQLIAHELTHVAQQAGGAPLVQRKPRGMRLASARPETTSFDLTGRYVAESAGGGAQFSVELNQAGRHVIGWIHTREFSPANDRAVSRDGHELSGTVVRDDGGNEIAFRYLAWSDAATAAGMATVRREDGVAHLELDSENHYQGGLRKDGRTRLTLRRVSSDARLPEEALDSIADPAHRRFARSRQEGQLGATEQRALDVAVGELEAAVAEYYRESAIRDGLASAMKESVDRLYRSVASAQHGEIENAIRHRLLADTLTRGRVTRPYWDWLGAIVQEHPDYTRALANDLGITIGTHQPGKQKHKYQWRLTQASKGVEGKKTPGKKSPFNPVGYGGSGGFLDVQKVAPDKWGPARFEVLFANASLGISAGSQLGSVTWNEFDSDVDWRPSNFHGWITIFSYARGLSLGVGKTRGIGAATFHGDGTFHPITGDAGGDTYVAGAYVGAEVSTAIGYAMYGNETARQRESLRQQLADPERIESRYSGANAPHFHVDSAILTEIGRSSIRDFVARYRAPLGERTTTIDIDGHTSTTASDEHNQTLSELRAANTLRVIQDLLGPLLAVPPGNIHVEGHGERAARAAGLADNTESRRWRRVDVRVNGRLALVLH